MPSKWLESASSSGVTHEDGTSTQIQASASGRQHGTRWFGVMQGIRRSLDVHLKSYYKIDSAYASIQRLPSTGDKLKNLAKALTDTGLVDFCCVYLVHPARGTFGVMAISGPGAELYPPRLADDEARRAARQCDSTSPAFLNVFNRCVFQVRDSNWCVEDVVASRAPWYYDCASAVNGFGLPQDGCWLRRSGLRSVLALPCMQGNDVTGVLAVASKQKSLDHLLLHKLEELCYKITPLVTEAVMKYTPLLCNRRMAAPYESVSDFAHEVLGELLNLDRAVAVSVGGIQRCSANMSQQQQQQQRQEVSGQRKSGTATAASCNGPGSRSRKPATEERSMLDAMSAMAAATAAGFSWTAPVAPPLALPLPAAVDPTPRKTDPAEQNPSSAQYVNGIDTFCTAQMDNESHSMVLTDNLSSLPVHAADVHSDFSLAIASEPPTPAAVAIELRPSVSPSPVSDYGAAAPKGSPSPPSRDLCRAQYVWASKSLPDCHATTVATGQLALGYLRGTEAVSYHGTQHASAACAGVALSGDLNTSRSTRSLSCLEFSGGITEARDELTTASGNNSPSTAQSGATSTKAVTAVAAVAPHMAAAAAARCEGAAAVWHLRAPQTCRGPVAADTASDVNTRRDEDRPCIASNRTSGSGDGYMIESRSTEDLAVVLRQGNCANDLKMTSPSFWSSKNMESRIMQRGLPLEPSIGGSSEATAAGGRVSPTTNAPSVSPSLPPTNPLTATGLSAARGSSCATECSMAGVDTAYTTFGYTNSSHYTMYGSNATRLSGAWDSQCGGGGVSDFGEIRTLLRGVARGRWSRDSAAAAAAVWSNETSEAFASALRFTARRTNDSEAPVALAQTLASGAAATDACGNGESSSVWTACIHRPAQTPVARFACAASTAAGPGGLYGICESSPVPSLQLSLEFTDSDDSGVVVVDLPSSDSSSADQAGDGSGGAFMLSSGLGVEAMRRHHHQEDRRGSYGSSSHPDPSVALLASCGKAGMLTGVSENMAMRS